MCLRLVKKMGHFECKASQKGFGGPQHGRFPALQYSLEITESHVVISVQKNVSCNLRHLFMAIVCAFGRIGTKLLLWIPGVEFYCKLEPGAHYNHANMVFINFFF